ncbi:MAG: protein kinase [Myxococcales bacterium]|nr:protein kinase [Myxococcales bacterium]
MVSRSPEALVGQTLGGRFRVLYIIASGGMGTVYEARDEVLARRVAIKVIRGDHLVDTALRARFKREALATAAVSHPALVALHDLSLDSDPPFFVMELVDGVALEDILAREQRIAWTRAATLAADALEGLDALHVAGVVHRDIKPSNLMIVGSGPAERCRLIDLGVARLMTAPIDDARTATGVAVGTPAYMAPEQLAGERVGPAADLWAMGVVLYKCIVGFHPFSASRSQGPLKPAHEINPEVPAELGALVSSLLAHNPADRPQSAGLVARRLRALLPHRAAVAMAPSPLPAAANVSTPGASHSALAAPVAMAHTQSTVPSLPSQTAPERTRTFAPVAVGIAIGVTIAAGGAVALQSWARQPTTTAQVGPISAVAIDERVPLVVRASGEGADARVAPSEPRVAEPAIANGARPRPRAATDSGITVVIAHANTAPPSNEHTTPAAVIERPATTTVSSLEPATNAAPFSGPPAVVLPSSPGNRPGNRLSVQYSSTAGRGVRDAVAPLVTPRLERCVDPRTHYAMRLLTNYRVRVNPDGSIESLHPVAHEGTDTERACIERALRAVSWPATGARYDTSVRATVQL